MHAIFVLVFILLSLGPSAYASERGAGEEFRSLWGPHYQAPARPTEKSQRPRRPRNRAADWVHHWNEVAIDASGLDHTPVAIGETRVFGEQYGPTRASRAMAIVHIAVFEAVNAIEGSYKSYVGLPHVHGDVSLRAAISQAAHDTLAALFPSQAPSFDAELANDLSAIAKGRAKLNGIDLGKRAALAILTLRANDGSQHAEPRVGVDFITSNDPGKWRQDPISLNPLALGALWEDVKPFVIDSAAQFRAPAPPALNSAAYTAAFNEVKQIGGDGIVTPTTRTAEQTEIGLFWAYDGTPSMCAPPRLYNQITTQIAEQMHTTNVVELARLLALVNVAMADAAIAVWESKYFYEYWRPITGIREAASDGNPATAADANFSPLGAPASNLNGPNFTPPFPAYPSGHAGFGGALFQVLRKFYKTDEIAFTFVSDEFNGVTKDANGNVRPLRPRSFTSLSQAEEENGQSRIYLGIHWVFDKTAGIAQGRQVADHVLKNVFAPLHGQHGSD